MYVFSSIKQIKKHKPDRFEQASQDRMQTYMDLSIVEKYKAMRIRRPIGRKFHAQLQTSGFLCTCGRRNTQRHLHDPVATKLFLVKLMHFWLLLIAQEQGAGPVRRMAIFLSLKNSLFWSLFASSRNNFLYFHILIQNTELQMRFPLPPLKVLLRKRAKCFSFLPPNAWGLQTDKESGS